MTQTTPKPSRKMQTVRRVLAVLGVLILGAIATGYLRFASRRDRNYALELSAPQLKSDPETLARGEHLARTLGGCADCHGKDFGGTRMSDDPPMTLIAPNITPGKGSAVTGFSPTDWARAIVYGVDRLGRSLIVMPSKELGSLADSDVAAIVSYMTLVPPIDRDTGKTDVKLLGKVVFGLTNAPVFSAEFDRAARERASVPPALGPTLEYGLYMANVCRGCHGADLRGGVIAHPGAPPSANISASALADWQFAEFERAMRQGKARDGHDLDPAMMPWTAFKSLSADELRALWIGLRQD